ncbi:hypothetical protein [uncultured Tenacibaculum sp.]|uniref:hypothetical protein n=1 Tax=uncultured Tenacibaculum sp. TaxID=174713 RepID=UPI002603AE60|nr:hypothetical protein [uncultured Tenacibaculum sp.]
MKRSIIILFTFILFNSCQNKEIERLNNKIFELKKLNKKLSDSLKKRTYKKLINSNLWGIPENNNLAINKPNKFKFVFSSIQKLPEYNIYAVTNRKGKKTRTLIYENYTDAEFEYNFIPENDKDNSFKIEALFVFDTIAIEIPGKINMFLKK